MTVKKQSSEDKEMALSSIWKVRSEKLAPGAWLWWFWLFFIHDENTEKTGKCRQLMILWSVKNDRKISCNGLDISVPKQIEALPGGKGWALSGAAAAWYFDGKEMHDNFVLEKSDMQLDPHNRKLSAPGKTPSEFSEEDGEYITKIKSGETEFEFRAKQVDKHAAVGPHSGQTKLPFGFGVEGTRIEVLELSGTEKCGNAEKRIHGTAYFQKILLAIPPPQWYWGIYHFSDGSYFTYMQTYMGRALLAHKSGMNTMLKKPSAPLSSDIFFYHAPTGRFFEGHKLSVTPSKLEGGLWKHALLGSGKGFEISAEAKAYAHSSWVFEKQIGPLPARSVFTYNEYPAVLSRLVVRLKSGETITLEKGVGNMENSWGFLL